MNILQITLSETTLIKLGRNVVELRQNDLGRNGLGAKRPVSYDRYLVWRAFSKTSIFRSKMLFTCGREVQTEKKNLHFPKYPDTCGRGLRCEIASGIVLCYSRQACCLLCCLCHINNGSHTYQFTFELLLLCFRMWLWFQI